MTDYYDLFGNFPMAERMFGIQGRGILATHSAEKCAGEFCCIHNPSDHPLRDALLNWRDDRRVMERICSHGVGHPDPDSLAFMQRVMTRAEYEARAPWDHGCDGCCS